MSCFPCFGSKKQEEPQEVPVAQAKDVPPPSSPPRPVSNAVNQSSEPAKKKDTSNENKDEQNAAKNGDNNGARTFTFREIAMATKNFKQEGLITEGGFGKVYKATLQSGEVVAVKRLDRNGTQGSKEFLVEVLMLTLLHHPHLADLIGYCADGDQRFLVYEYLPTGGLDSLLYVTDDKKPLSWQSRMKIAYGIAQGLEYLHEKANPPIIYRDLKPSNILMDEDLNPKLFDYGLAKLTQGDTKTHLSPIMVSNGYCAPEYERNGELTLKSDVYSFGVILLELISGRQALDTSRPTEVQNLVDWAQPIFRDPKRYPDMADPLLKKDFPERSLNQAVGVAAMCIQEEPSVRPLIGDIVAALSFLAVSQDIPPTLPSLNSISLQQKSISSSSRSSSSSGDDHSPRSNSHAAAAAEESHDGSVGSSSKNRRYDESSAWSIGSSSRYKSVRQESRSESNGSHSRRKSNSDSEEES